MITSPSVQPLPGIKLESVKLVLDLLTREAAHTLLLYEDGKPVALHKSFRFVQVPNRDQLFAGVDVADAITLIVEAAREVKAHPTAVLALILISWWPPRGPPVTSISC